MRLRLNVADELPRHESRGGLGSASEPCPMGRQTPTLALLVASGVDSAEYRHNMNVSKDKISGYKTYGKRRSLRLPGFDYRSPHAYHLTWGTVDRKQLLRNPSIVIPLIEELKVEAKDRGILLYAYCFMPDHVHLLVSPERGQDVVSFIQSYKSKTTRIYWGMGNRGKLWQHGFYDHILRQEESIQGIARYILENPVRKGLVDDFRDYPFSGSLIFEKSDL